MINARYDSNSGEMTTEMVGSRYQITIELAYIVKAVIDRMIEDKTNNKERELLLTIFNRSLQEIEDEEVDV